MPVVLIERAARIAAPVAVAVFALIGAFLASGPVPPAGRGTGIVVASGTAFVLARRRASGAPHGPGSPASCTTSSGTP